MRRTTTKRKPPSRIRYEENHPVLSCRIPQADYDLLKQRLKELNISFATFVKNALERLEIKMTDIDEAKNEGYKQGYEQAQKDHQIWYYCNVCQERINISPNGESHKALIQYLKEHGWGHVSCHEKEKEKTPLYRAPVFLHPYHPYHPYQASHPRMWGYPQQQWGYPQPHPPQLRPPFY